MCLLMAFSSPFWLFEGKTCLLADKKALFVESSSRFRWQGEKQ